MELQSIGKRIRALREERGLSQEALARLLGFKDRQIVSNIETGGRRVKAEELVLAAQKLVVPLDYFIDPFLLAGEGYFSWRRSDVSHDQVATYEHHAGNWLAAFRNLAPKVGHDMMFFRHTLALTANSSYEDAMRAGERFVTEFNLGATPTTRLVEVMEQKLGILVLMVDTEEGVSGASCRLPELDAVLISRREVVGRRHFDLAHELFHLMTWDAMTPKHEEDSSERGGGRVEQLANNFASALLMPTSIVQQADEWRLLRDAELVSRLNTVADDLSVTSSALRWRLVALGELKLAQAKAIPDCALWNNGHDTPQGETPALFSKEFMDVMGRALHEGRVSVRRLSNLLDLTFEDLGELLQNYGLDYSVDI